MTVPHKWIERFERRDELHRRVVSTAAAAQTVQELHTLLESIHDRPALADFVAALSRNPSVLLAIAARSYVHDNGFSKIVLNQDNGCSLRIHVWDPPDSAALPNIHNHRWDYASVLLAGVYTEEVYVRTEDNTAEAASAFTYRPAASAAAHDELIPAGESRLRIASRRAVGAGDFTGLPAATLHRITLPQNAYTASLFLTGRVQRDTTDVFSRGAPSRVPESISRELTVTDLETRLHKLAAVLRSA
jgi:hypothetical protein